MNLFKLIDIKNSKIQNTGVRIQHTKYIYLYKMSIQPYSQIYTFL